MSLKFIPESSQPNAVDSTKFGQSAPSAPGLQDILRSEEGPLSISSKINNRHPLENRIQNWEQTQHDLKLEQYRRIFGAAEPIKRTMELKIVESTDFTPSALGNNSNIHRDILLNKDTSIDWEDIYSGMFYYLFGIIELSY
ncbi:Proteasome maturation factor UMP1 [Wickerhamomyces ciferrii]|uniref:Proteasome maturation factor UMP1 n=1 Tax=Wickerhamomyces ciferrii (strain ATCC 14091 / BCRC 22168 / CBS 111 / JCM 3599 / NBRC 0793 / NRRL Y-1031 F-60-10) TaxID=1206466 RepID=K0KIL3_WICCF|nr:Proteasome maturation factor UMP1 [Wickerhamomyces ciferrii]CCH45060.1 Proteasome maturation factor UMP1 [Wickerhamomyces ciferrii]